MLTKADLNDWIYVKKSNLPENKDIFENAFTFLWIFAYSNCWELVMSAIELIKQQSYSANNSEYREVYSVSESRLAESCSLVIYLGPDRMWVSLSAVRGTANLWMENQSEYPLPPPPTHCLSNEASYGPVMSLTLIFETIWHCLHFIYLHTGHIRGKWVNTYLASSPFRARLEGSCWGRGQNKSIFN